jgi:hypothetical protein
MGSVIREGVGDDSFSLGHGGRWIARLSRHDVLFHGGEGQAMNVSLSIPPAKVQRIITHAVRGAFRHLQIWSKTPGVVEIYGDVPNICPIQETNLEFTTDKFDLLKKVSLRSLFDAGQWLDTPGQAREQAAALRREADRIEREWGIKP